ncbi:hypothetical protein MNEG_12449 [Monoraphidium neglectum]|uniref:Uncharacterized protein n=1 Tax=Monoraphidium neglectum TaxID=145388 RepID=A0A0D2LVA6_9CHLO|nr:hypothetical protein MNEG_12449 [Monoraphidium neglectum]KIY95514.1 hypothetical protein MNEG_12449 [Monoraphidium neglectum]|eukprot:XP_013894534.1 hypothetical protein MNEG_12449 [Monoraphidium neglectum]
MEPTTSFYQTALSGYYAASLADSSHPNPPPPPPDPGDSPPTPPCRFINYPDTLQGGAPAALQAALSGGGGGGGGGVVERFNPLKLLGRMNRWLCRRCRAMLLDGGVKERLLALQDGGGGNEGGGEVRDALEQAPPVTAVLVNFPDQW